MKRLWLRRLCTAELERKRFDLAPGCFERAGTVDFLGGEKKLFLDGKLRCDATSGFGFAEAARDQAPELLFGRAPRDHQAIELFVYAGFDQQRGFHEDRVADSSAPPRLELAEDDLSDARMDDGVEAVEFGAIAEDDGAEFRAVHAAAGGEHRFAEFLDDFVVGGLAGLDQFVREGVGVENGKAHFAQHGGDGAFAAGDSTGEAETEHDVLIIARRPSIALQKILARRGGGGPLSRCCS